MQVNTRYINSTRGTFASLDLKLASLVNMVLESPETIRLIRDGEKDGVGGMEVGEEGDYIPIATLSAPE